MRDATRTSWVRGGGFTLIELLVSISIVALLAALLLGGISRAVATARQSSGERSVEALALAVGQFKSRFGFLPPLVHDGEALAGDGMLPAGAGTPSSEPTWPVVENEPPLRAGSRRLMVWSEGADRDFFRRRAGSGGDGVELPGGGSWDIARAWDDRRYSKYSLPYYLSGIGANTLDGVDGPGMARPQSDGYFVGVAYPVGSSRDRYEPVIEGDKESLRLVTGYFEGEAYAEHGQPAPGAATAPDSHAAFVDPWGRAIRYYRWQAGRLENGRLTVRTTLDLNIPPLLLAPALYVDVSNNPSVADDIDLTDGSPELRGARYAIVSAGPDGLFGTEDTVLIAERLDRPAPTNDRETSALRALAMDDNIVGLGD